MAVSGISSATASNSQSANSQNLRQLFMQLVKDIQSGNLDAAKTDYSSLTQLQGSNGGDGPFSQAMSQIGQSLQSNDISGAQQALASLQQQLQGNHHAHHHHHHGGGSPPPDPNAIAPVDGSNTSPGTINLIV